MLQVVWFKKDLRIHDHEPLCQAVKAGPTIFLYTLEPEYLQQPDTSGLHLWWTIASLHELNKSLQSKGAKLYFRNTDILTALESILKQQSFTLHSHQETGNQWSYHRDIKVQKWCAENNIHWNEYLQFGVFRRLKNRNSWSLKRDELMAKPLIDAPLAINNVAIDGEIIPDPLSFLPPGITPDLRPGEQYAKKLLSTFLRTRGQEYIYTISSPQRSKIHGSRLSPYITYGNISIRQIQNALQQKLSELNETPASKEKNRWQRSLTAMQSRLYWHCHFIQKLESEPSIEFQDFIPAFSGMRTESFNQLYLEAWKQGKTGYPLIDACMRCLTKTGWINFRMRAMLVSFIAYDLLIDWRKFAHYLATLFIDYEPGIHYPQIQMQSGTTGINATRMYDPVKQSYDHDPKGIFIRTWIPELTNVPDCYIHEPWRMTKEEQKKYHFTISTAEDADYPTRIVEHKTAIKKARLLLAKYRASPEVASAIQSTLKKHGSRRKISVKRTARKTKKQNTQLGFDF